MKTHSLSSEILLALSPDTSISESFSRFGLTAATTNVIVVSALPDDDVLPSLKHYIGGTYVGDDTSMDLEGLRDMAAISQLARVEALTAQLEAFMAGETATLQRARRAVLPPLQQQESLLSKMLALMPPSVFPTQTQQLAQQQPTGVNGPSDRNGSPPDLDVDVENRQDPRHDSSSSSSPSASDPAPQKSDSKPPRSLQLLTELEASRIPQYITRMTCDKINLAVAELNKLIEDKYTVLKMPQPKMNKLQRSLFWEHKQLASMTPETKGHVFVTEKDLKDKEGWTKSTFKFDAVGRSVIAVLRHLGRIREVRGGGHTRIVLL
eukprot:jgi/Hompol1/4820/HPOL_003904-RA